MMNARNLVLILFSVTAVLLVVLSAGLVYFYPGTLAGDSVEEAVVSDISSAQQPVTPSAATSDRTLTITVIPLEPVEDLLSEPTPVSLPSVMIDTDKLSPGVTDRIEEDEAVASAMRAAASIPSAPVLPQAPPAAELEVSTVSAPEPAPVERIVERPVPVIVAVEPSLPMLAEREQQGADSRESVMIQEPALKTSSDFAPLVMPEPEPIAPVVPEPVVVAEEPVRKVESPATSPEPAPIEEPEPEVTIAADPTPEPAPIEEPVPEVIIAAEPEPEPEPVLEPEPAALPEPVVEPSPEPSPEPEPLFTLPDTRPVYWAVIGVYESLEAAEHGQDQLMRENGVHSLIPIQDEETYHVQIGPYTNALEAGRMGEMIASLDGFDTSRVKLSIPRF